MRLGLILGEVGSGLRRNVSMVVSVVLVTFVSLTFVGAAILLQMQINEMKGFWYDRAQVVVYMCSDLQIGANCVDGAANEIQVDAVQAQLETGTLAPYVDEAVLEDQQQSYERFLEQYAGQPQVDFVTVDNFSPTFYISLVDSDQAAVIQEGLSGFSGVENVRDQREYLDPVFAILNAASVTAVAIAGLMLVAAALLISTTIRLSAFSRRRELSIMRLVGASNAYIQAPFILEGVVAALFGSLLAGGAILAIVHFFIRGYLVDTVQGVSLIGLGEGLIVVPILVAIGAVLAAVASSFAISRYLKV